MKAIEYFGGMINPIGLSNKANKKLKEEIANLESNGEEQIQDYAIDQVATEVYKDHYYETFNIKNKLEEKAKTNVIGLTIAISLIMGASNIINVIYDKFSSFLFRWVVFAVILIAVIYMIAAGILAIKVLIDENRVYYVNSSNYVINDKELKQKYIDKIKLNEKRNLIRNNSVFASYLCIRNSLICLFLILILIILPINGLANTNMDGYITSDSSTGKYDFLYSESAVDFIKLDGMQILIEDVVVDNIEHQGDLLDDGCMITLFDDSNNIFIKYKYNDEEITILMIETVDYSTSTT